MYFVFVLDHDLILATKVNAAVTFKLNTEFIGKPKVSINLQSNDSINFQNSDVLTGITVFIRIIRISQ